MPEKGSSEPTRTKSHLACRSNRSLIDNERNAVRANLLFRKVDRVLVLVRLNMQLVVTNGSDCSVEAGDNGIPLCPLVCVPVGIFSVPKRIQRV
jgi:hypothetical protein